MTSERLADQNRREANDALRRAANAGATGPFAQAQTAGYVGTAAARTDPRPTLRQHLWELERGKPLSPPAPDFSAQARQAAIAERTEKMLAINQELAAQPHRKEELERDRDRLALELQVLQPGAR